MGYYAVQQKLNKTVSQLYFNKNKEAVNAPMKKKIPQERKTLGASDNSP